MQLLALYLPFLYAELPVGDPVRALAVTSHQLALRRLSSPSLWVGGGARWFEHDKLDVIWKQLEGLGGDICIAARATESGVEIAVTDNGPGIPADFLPRVFEPHFSTRSAGTGLGLAIVRRLVESWGGAVTAESEPGAGTTIRVTLRQVITFP